MTTQGIWYHAITVISLISFKLAVLVVGYFIAKLGYQLLVKGVTGEFKFRTEFKDTKADLVSASPGIFFIAMATILIATAIIKDIPFETTVTQRKVESSAEQRIEEDAIKEKPVAPEKAPIGH